jgi:mediator of RNA polymerase II transcription subunit 6
MTISSAIAKALPAAEAARKWRPSTGHVYTLPASQSSTTQSKSQEEKPVLDVAGKAASATAKHDAPSMDRVAEESLLIHLRYGGEYIDEIPITGKPGEFHLSSTGRKPVLPPQGAAAPTGISAMSGPPMINTKLDDKKDGKADKTPKSATMPKLKRKKSKMSPSVTPAATPAAS